MSPFPRAAFWNAADPRRHPRRHPQRGRSAVRRQAPGPGHRPRATTGGGSLTPRAAPGPAWPDRPRHRERPRGEDMCGPRGPRCGGLRAQEVTSLGSQGALGAPPQPGLSSPSSARQAGRQVSPLSGTGNERSSSPFPFLHPHPINRVWQRRALGTQGAQADSPGPPQTCPPTHTCTGPAGSPSLLGPFHSPCGTVRSRSPALALPTSGAARGSRWSFLSKAKPRPWRQAGAQGEDSDGRRVASPP